MFEALAPCHPLWQRAYPWNIIFKTLYGGQFMLSTQLIILNYLPSYWINWFNLKSCHNLTIHSIYLPIMKVSLFCTGHNSQVHDISCTICDCGDGVNLSLDSLTYSVMSWSPASCISGRDSMTPLPPSLSLSIIAQKQINWMFLNPL